MQLNQFVFFELNLFVFFELNLFVFFELNLFVFFELNQFVFFEVRVNYYWLEEVMVQFSLKQKSMIYKLGLFKSSQGCQQQGFIINYIINKGNEIMIL